MTRFQYLVPNWPLPQGVKSVVTTRQGMPEPLQDKLFNFLDTSPEQQQEVWRNRHDLAAQLGLAMPAQWLIQMHGVDVCNGSRPLSKADHAPRVDACVSRSPGLACVIQSADCLPVLFSSHDGLAVAAAHAGWRGLSAGIIGKTVDAMDVDPTCLSVYLGPAISQRHFEVGKEVKAAFVDIVGADKKSVEACFIPSSAQLGHFYADLYQLARLQLFSLGITRIFGGDYCTYADHERFYSYRREGQTGRMASVIWLDS